MNFPLKKLIKGKNKPPEAKPREIRRKFNEFRHFTDFLIDHGNSNERASDSMDKGRIPISERSIGYRFKSTIRSGRDKHPLMFVRAEVVAIDGKMTRKGNVTIDVVDTSDAVQQRTREELERIMKKAKTIADDFHITGLHR